MVHLGLPIKNGWIFHGYVSHNQRVSRINPDLNWGDHGTMEDWNSSWPARGNALWSRRRGSFGLKSSRSPCKDEGRSKVNRILTESSGKTIYPLII